jgi:exodeoxyribonuclease V alpha subunit
MTTLDELRAAGALGALDFRFAEALERLAAERLEEKPRREVVLAAALASHQTSEGHVCVDLVSPPLLTGEDGAPLANVRWPEPELWIDAVSRSALVATPGASDAEPKAPLVLDAAGRVYLQRFWCHQKGLARAILARAQMTFEPHDSKRLARELARLFPESDASFPWQRAAALTALRRGLTVVTGGPGTGKTATVVRMLALLVGEAMAGDARLPRVLLVAPTGKAAARLTDSIEKALPGLDCRREIRAHLAELPRAASTIHRALGTYGSSVTRFRHDADNPLVADVVVVDEASMVDLALMNRLVSAMAPSARLVLLGDRDQLASVEAGAVLGDLCDAEALKRGYSNEHLDELTTLGGIFTLFGAPSSKKRGLRDSIVRLTHSYRYVEESGIGRLAAAIRDGRAEEALRVLESGRWPDVVRIEPAADRALDPAVEQRIVDGYRAALQAVDPAVALRAMDGFRVLAAHRRGLFGVEVLNARIVELLRDEGLVGAGDGQFAGRTVLVTRNDYTLSLFNGDVGLVVRDAGDPERLAATFPAPGGKVRRLSPARLPTHETAFAMTVHKSQGSEVDELVLVLPAASPLVTRELLYTAVTRARRAVIVQATRDALAKGIETETKRTSGLRDLLWR